MGRRLRWKVPVRQSDRKNLNFARRYFSTKFNQPGHLGAKRAEMLQPGHESDHT
jgi:hypothetical protein